MTLQRSPYTAPSVEILATFETVVNEMLVMSYTIVTLGLVGLLGLMTLKRLS